MERWVYWKAYWSRFIISKCTGSQCIIQIVDAIKSVRKFHCQLLLSDHKNHELLKKENFDLAIAQIFDGCSLGLFEVIGIKKYVVAHSGALVPTITSYLGLPRSLSSVPSLFSSNTEKMNFLQRTTNFIGTLFEDYIMGPFTIDGPQEAINEALPGMDIHVSLYY